MRIKTRYKLTHYAVAVGCLVVNGSLVLLVLSRRWAAPLPPVAAPVASNVVKKAAAPVPAPVEQVESNKVLTASDFYVSGSRSAFAFGRVFLVGDRSPWGIVRQINSEKILLDSESGLVEIKKTPLGDIGDDTSGETRDVQRAGLSAFGF